MCNWWSTINDWLLPWYVTWKEKCQISLHLLCHSSSSGSKNLNDHLHKTLQIVITAVNKTKTQTLSDLINYFGRSILRMMKILNVWCFFLQFVGCQRQLWDFFFLAFWHCCGDFWRHKCFLSDKLREIRHNIAYLSGIFTKFN